MPVSVHKCVDLAGVLTFDIQWGQQQWAVLAGQDITGPEHYSNFRYIQCRTMDVADTLGMDTMVRLTWTPSDLDHILDTFTEPISLVHTAEFAWFQCRPTKFMAQMNPMKT